MSVIDFGRRLGLACVVSMALLAGLLAFAQPVVAQTEAPAGVVETAEPGLDPPGVAEPAAPLRVGVYECPPFVIREADGVFDGLSIGLWNGVAQMLGLTYEFIDLDLAGVLDGVAAGDLDAAISCVSITPEREEFIDFSHSFYETHLAIAVRQQGMLGLLAGFLSNRQALMILGGILGLAALVGGLFFLLEKGSNAKLYSRPSRAGRMTEAFIMGLLFITRGPVNYYEFHTLAGRVLTVLLAIFTTLFLASFTAVLASSFTLDRLQSQIGGPEDLANVTVGVKAASTASEYLDARGITYRAFADTDAVLTALESGLIDAAVGDDPVLKFEIRQAQEVGALQQLLVLPHQFEKQNYGILLPTDSPLVEGVNVSLLRVREDEGWAAMIGQLIGDQP